MDPGAECCILTVFIKTDVVIRDPIDKIKSTLAVKWAPGSEFQPSQRSASQGKARTGNVNWGKQFKDAVFDVYGDDDEDEAWQRRLSDVCTEPG